MYPNVPAAVLLAYTDPLTGLANRRRVEERIETALWDARSGGHAAGDDLLVAVAQQLRARAAPRPAARLGGDEFLVPLPGLDPATAQAEAHRVTEQLAARVSRPVLMEGREIVLGASIGTSVHPDDGDTFSALLHEADGRMYAAKTGHRGTAAPASRTGAGTVGAEVVRAGAARRLSGGRRHQDQHVPRTEAELVPGREARRRAVRTPGPQLGIHRHPDADLVPGPVVHDVHAATVHRRRGVNGDGPRQPAPAGHRGRHEPRGQPLREAPARDRPDDGDPAGPVRPRRDRGPPAEEGVLVPGEDLRRGSTLPG